MTAQMLSNKSSLSSEKTLWSDKGSKSEVLANIYNKEKNIVIWQRKLTRALVKSAENILTCLLYTSPSPRDVEESRMPSSA